MTKINKINVNGNVYDIQDNSSGYVKGTEISDLVNQLVDEKVAEFLKAGFNTETVDELPTENISYKTIYLVPSEKEEEENIYDEYIYTSKDEWEIIGSTKTDLTDYYTKEEVDNAIANIAGSLKTYVLTSDGYSLSAPSGYTVNEYITEIIANIENAKIYLKNGDRLISLSSFYLKDNVNWGQFYFDFNSGLDTDNYYDWKQIRIQFNFASNVNREVIGAGAFITKYYVIKDINQIADKQYVDDQVGAINTILATLTTIEEGE